MDGREGHAVNYVLAGYGVTLVALGAYGFAVVRRGRRLAALLGRAAGE